MDTNERNWILGALCVAICATIALYFTQHPKPQPQPAPEYSIGQIPGLSQCDYLAVRHGTNQPFTIITHKGDCRYCAALRGLTISPQQFTNPPAVKNTNN